MSHLLTSIIFALRHFTRLCREKGLSSGHSSIIVTRPSSSSKYFHVFQVAPEDQKAYLKGLLQNSLTDLQKQKLFDIIDENNDGVIQAHELHQTFTDDIKRI